MVCESSIVLWPDVEHIDLYCVRLAGHEGRHVDPDGNNWTDPDDHSTFRWGTDSVG